MEEYVSSTSSKGLYFLVILILAAIGGAMYLLLKDMQHPEVSLSPQQEFVSNNTEFIVEAQDTGAGIKSFGISVNQGDKQVSLLEKTFPKAQAKVLEKVTLENAGLENGPIELVVTAGDASFANFGRGNAVRVEQVYTLDTIPPRIIQQAMIQNVTQGGAGCVSYRLDAPASQSGVFVRDMFFPGFEQPDGSYTCLFPFPYYMEPETFRPILTAVDPAGNQANITLGINALSKKFREDTINLPDSFLDTKMPEFAQTVPGNMTNLERFLKVNRELRTTNRDALKGVARMTAATPLWHGVFLRMPRAATKAIFGDHRTYLYNGKEVDNQIHLGVDLASVKHADIPAANDGTVVFADYMGIYGQVVIIDHGLGLQSLYGHLSQILVTKGQQVKKGDTVGKSGMSGMAGGDHLHFGMIIGGVPVNPIEWWDDHWLRVSLKDIMPQAVGK